MRENKLRWLKYIFKSEDTKAVNVVENMYILCGMWMVEEPKIMWFEILENGMKMLLVREKKILYVSISISLYNFTFYKYTKSRNKWNLRVAESKQLEESLKKKNKTSKSKLISSSLYFLLFVILPFNLLIFLLVKLDLIHDYNKNKK